MTTHDMQPEMVDRPGDNHPVTQPPLETVDATPDFEAPAQPEPMAPAHAQPEQVADESVEQTLFDDRDLTDFHTRWTEVQAAFVDDPRDCVQKADGLVSDVVDRLTAGFSQARSGLEEQWSRGESASTEDLRLALRRYRDFFDRLLAV